MQTKPSISASNKRRSISVALIMGCPQLFLTSCSWGGAPSFDLFGAFFPAWLLCGVVGIVGAVAARITFVTVGVANTLPYQLAVCTAIGATIALVFWLVGFGR